MKKIIALILSMLVLAACSGVGSEDHREADEDTQNTVHTRLQETVPVPEIEGAAAREAIVRHLERWQSSDVVSFVTIFADTGNPVGYYEASGKVANTCQMLTAPERIVDRLDSDHVVQAPALDGTYYTSGSECGLFFFTATGDTYVELTPGWKAIITDQPLPIDVEPLQVQVNNSDD